MIGKLLVPSFDFLAASDDSSFCLLWGALIQLGPPLQFLYVVFISLVETESFVDACIWDEFLVTAAVLERSTLFASPHWLIPRFFLVVETILLCHKHI